MIFNKPCILKINGKEVEVFTSEEVRSLLYIHRDAEIIREGKK